MIARLFEDIENRYNAIQPKTFCKFYLKYLVVPPNGKKYKIRKFESSFVSFFDFVIFYQHFLYVHSLSDLLKNTYYYFISHLETAQEQTIMQGSVVIDQSYLKLELLIMNYSIKTFEGNLL